MNAAAAVHNEGGIRVYLRRFRVHLRSRFLVVAAPVFATACGASGESDSQATNVAEVRAGGRVRVEVINTTTQRGLARRATFFLRDQGFDVVRYASGAPARDSTQVVDRIGRRELAQLVARALGVSRVVAEVDSARYLDVSVYLGRDWRPPAKPFYP
jgi:hypothetical protein